MPSDSNTCLDQIQAMVREFHAKFNRPHRIHPFTSDVDWVAHKKRGMWVQSEVDELFQAIADDSLPDLADAYLDIVYFAIGGLVELGINGSPLMAAVHEANMAKINVPGVPKIQKPEGWKEPPIAALIEAQRK